MQASFDEFALSGARRPANWPSVAAFNNSSLALCSPTSADHLAQSVAVKQATESKSSPCIQLDKRQTTPALGLMLDLVDRKGQQSARTGEDRQVCGGTGGWCINASSGRSAASSVRKVLPAFCRLTRSAT